MVYGRGDYRKMNNTNENKLIAENKFIEIICDNEHVFLNVQKIQYIERVARKIKIVSGTEEYFIYESLASVLKRLPSNFVRCHTGYIVNMNYVDSMHPNYLVMKDDCKISIGRTYKHSVANEFS